MMNITLKTLMALKDTQVELSRKVNELKEEMNSSDDARAGVQEAMRQYIRVRPEDLQCLEWSPDVRKRVTDYTAAMAKADIMKAVENGQLEQRDMYSGHSACLLFNFIESSRELAGLSEVLVWIEQFAGLVQAGDTNVIMGCFVQLEVARPGSCGCGCDGDLIDERSIDFVPELWWCHQNHRTYNRAIWEILAARPGLIESLRRAIQADIDGPNERIGRCIFGKVIARTYARKLLASFIKERPSTKWVGDMEIS